MNDYAIERLYEKMTEVFGLEHFTFAPSMTSSDVPGWDSLRHTMLVMELGDELGITLDGQATAALPDIGALHAFIVGKLR